MAEPLSIAVIGAGASGLLAAITAARAGQPVLLLERQERVGKKIPATGNGRCNLTNTRAAAGHYHGQHPEFTQEALRAFSPGRTIEFFQGLGVLTREEEEGKIFPRTGQASTILDALRLELERVAVNVRTQAEVNKIEKRGPHFIVHLPAEKFPAAKVIVAGGGRAMPDLGGSALGIKLLEALGHRAVGEYPALVPLKTAFVFNRHLKGVKLKARIRLLVQGKPTAEEEGEALFMEYGLSGPVVIQLSLRAGAALRQGKSVSLIFDCLPDFGDRELAEHLAERFRRRPGLNLEAALLGLVHKRLIAPLLCGAGLENRRRRAGSVTAAESQQLAHLLKNWVFPVSGTLSWNEAHVMAGGIATADFSSRTLESKLVPGLYACGEVLDITGDCGGFNLQWAWASGYLAGASASRERN